MIQKVQTSKVTDFKSFEIFTLHWDGRVYRGVRLTTRTKSGKRFGQFLWDFENFESLEFGNFRSFVSQNF